VACCHEHSKKNWVQDPQVVLKKSSAKYQPTCAKCDKNDALIYITAEGSEPLVFTKCVVFFDLLGKYLLLKAEFTP
jgi:hypothetical protein